MSNKKKEKDKKSSEKAKHSCPFVHSHRTASEKSTGEIPHKIEPTWEKSRQQETNRSNKGLIEPTMV
ncbi:hypothetical protein PanWU01x14_328930 [Parasponia andersonii]|uniref:Uncharacterized protein n=1 Tax=Parasponia andersonii TaxID=3476 RepID=A0A2P5AIK6_PARAD|nr:hypothetical protein PanWU01x14_328930 [Parasponia andersonii]